MLEFIIFFIGVIIAEGIGVYLGLRLQQEKIQEDLKKLKEITEKVRIGGTTDESGIVKALTPEQMEAERKKKLEKEIYG